MTRVHTPRRTSAPAELISSRDRWTRRFLDIRSGIRAGDWATRTAKRLLRDALSPITHGKCIYCESALEVTSEMAIEHYIAKTVATHLTFEWTNLLPACRKCNGAKAENDHGGALLKPDIEDPEPFFWIKPDTGSLQPHPSLDNAGYERALKSIALCDLQRPPLCTQRILMLGRVVRWINPRTQYKFVLRHLLRQHNLPSLEQVDRDRFDTGL